MTQTNGILICIVWFLRIKHERELHDSNLNKKYKRHSSDMRIIRWTPEKEWLSSMNDNLGRTDKHLFLPSAKTLTSTPTSPRKVKLEETNEVESSYLQRDIIAFVELCVLTGDHHVSLTFHPHRLFVRTNVGVCSRGDFKGPASLLTNRFCVNLVQFLVTRDRDHFCFFLVLVIMKIIQDDNNSM